MENSRFGWGLLMSLFLLSCNSDPSIFRLENNIRTKFSSVKGVFALAFLDIGDGETLFINERDSFHAASTMKAPVMIEVFNQARSGQFDLYDSLVVKNLFFSIVDSSIYSLSVGEDSEESLYKMIGKPRSIYDLMYDMIISSSNLATNIIIELIDAKKVTQTMRSLGAEQIKILRGVEDLKAYELGMSNSTNAYDLMIIYEQIANGTLVDGPACEDMIKILLDQKYNEIIPALLPKDVKVAHKTGAITGVHHDSGIVFLPDSRKYVLVILSKQLADFDTGTKMMAEVSQLIFQYMENKKNEAGNQLLK